MRQMINKLNEINFNRATDRHQFNDIYEQILADLQGAGNAGEYYTPRAVTQFIVDMVDPKLGETVLDPACGTGGFLVCAIKHVRKQYVKSAAQEARLQEGIRGIEKKPMPHLLCTTNMILHEIEVPSNIRHDNALVRPLRDYGPKDRVDVIVANPPFGGMEEDGVEKHAGASWLESPGEAKHRLHGEASARAYLLQDFPKMFPILQSGRMSWWQGWITCWLSSTATPFAR